VEDIAKQAVSRYSEGGIVALSFGLLLMALLWDAWQSRKQASADRTTYTEHVVKFATVMSENTKVMERSTEAPFGTGWAARGLKGSAMTLDTAADVGLIVWSDFGGAA
jgi:hypothetical protein